jgi:hypothetical protein
MHLYYILMYFNVFECIYRHCNWISTSLSHCNVFAMHTHLHIFFLHSIQWLPSQHAIPLRSFFSILVDLFQLSYNLSLLFMSIHHSTFHIPHSMSSLVVRSIAEPKFHINNIVYNIIFNSNNTNTNENEKIIIYSKSVCKK